MQEVEEFWILVDGEEKKMVDVGGEEQRRRQKFSSRAILFFLNFINLILALAQYLQ